MKKKFDKAKGAAGRLPVKRRAGSRSQSPTPPDPDLVRFEDQSPSVHFQGSLSTIREETASAIDELKDIIDQDNANLFSPLKVALVGLVRLCREDKQCWVAEGAIAAFDRRVRAFEMIANAATANDIAGNNNLRKRLRCIAEVVRHLWDEVGTMAEQATDCSEGKGILEVLSDLLAVFEFEDGMPVEHRLPMVRRLLSSRPAAVAMEDHVSGVISNNSNTNYAFGSNIVNNNSVNVFQRKSPVSDHAKTEKVLEEIKSLIGSQFVPTALHDTQPKEAGCMPGTRVNVLKKFVDWVKNDPKAIFWLAGLAGTGKTSIAITLCRMLQDDPDVLLGGTFFCSRTTNEEARTDVRRILPTLVTLLAHRCAQFAARLASQLRPDTGAAAHKPASEQVKQLLQRPLTEPVSEARPIVFVIDALDECSNDYELSQFLSAIVTFTSPARVKFILTSRPETHILGTPISDETRNDILQLHMIGPEEVAEDIRVYIEHKFSQKSLGGLRSWYSEADVTALASLANGLFIFASTAIAYIIDTDDFEDRQARLTTALSAMKNSKVATGPLDKVYEFVITRASSTYTVEPAELRRTQRVLACILRSRMPLSLAALSELLEMNAGTLRSSLRRLRAVVHVPNDLNQPDLRTLHASFGDYLFERATPEVRIISSLGDEELARGCLLVMNKRLHFNVSQSQSSYEPNPSERPDTIVVSLEYACLQWIYHVSISSEPLELDEIVDRVFRPRFLFWLEVMSILGDVWRAAIILLFAATTVRLPDLSRFLRDANLFVASSREAIERSAPHIYLSALPMAAKDSLIYKTFAHRCKGLISIATHGITQHEGRLLMTLKGHDDSVMSAAYYPSGLSIGSGSKDGTVRIWDVRNGGEALSPLRSGDGEIRSIAIAPDGMRIASGTEVGVVCIWNVSAIPARMQRLLGHSDRVTSVDFSPDGSLVASASDDNSVHIWTIETGGLLMALRGHAGGVNAVTFSPDSKIVASSSADSTIRLWHANTGDLIGQPLGKHTSWAWSICFSPDSELLASGHWDRNIRLWDIQTGTIIKTLRGHLEAVTCVHFAPDGQSLVSCGYDVTVRLWSLKPDSAECSSVALGRHKSWVSSVRFSPDGLYAVSACLDGTIRIWSTDHGPPMAQPLQAHESAVNSVSISPDGANIVSASKDGSVRVWDILNSKQKLPPLRGHEHSVHSVAVSSDGYFIASGSADRTVRLWNARTGEAVGEPLSAHLGGVNGVAFSPDGRWLASGSEDGFLHIWDVVTRRPSSIGPLHLSQRIQALVFSPDGRFVAAAIFCRQIHIWEIATGQPPLILPTVHHGCIRNIVFSPSGERIAFGAYYGAVHVLEISTGRRVLQLCEGNFCVLSVAYSQDGRFIAAGSDDGSVRLWNSATGARLSVLYAQGQFCDVYSVVFTSDSRSIVSGSADQTIRVWDVEAALQITASNGNSSLMKALAVTKSIDEWLQGPSGELLLWIPDAYRPYIQVPPCTTLFAERRVVITADASGLHAGEDWTSCWVGEM